MVFVQRQNGVIVGVFNLKQENIAEERVADDSVELLAFYNPPKQVLTDKAKFLAATGLSETALKVVLTDLMGGKL